MGPAVDDRRSPGAPGSLSEGTASLNARRGDAIARWLRVTLNEASPGQTPAVR